MSRAEDILEKFLASAREYDDTGLGRHVQIPVGGGFMVDFEPRGIPYRLVALPGGGVYKQKRVPAFPHAYTTTGEKIETEEHRPDTADRNPYE